MQFQIGVMADSFRLPIREALKKAAQLGADGVQIYATQGEVCPEALSAAQRRELLQVIRDLGLRVSALCGDFGHGFHDREKNRELVERSKRVLELACDLDTKVVTTHIGVVPAESTHPRYAVMQQACRELAAAADSMGVRFAVETGPETSQVLKTFLDSLESKGVSVNLDPANLVMVTGDNPVQAVHTLRDYIVHTHAKDGVMLHRAEPEIIYGLKQAPPDMQEPFREVPLGEGSVDFPAYLRALREIGYTGFLTIEREVGEDPGADIAAAAGFLRKTISEM